MSYAKEWQGVLNRMDVKEARVGWKKFFPHMVPPATDHEMEIVLHLARTKAESSPFRDRAFSHRWLSDRDLPSGLPDDLKPKAERVYPVHVDAVGYSYMFASPILRPIRGHVEAAVGAAIEDCFANGDTNPIVVRARMAEAKAREIEKLVGIKGV